MPSTLLPIPDLSDARILRYKCGLRPYRRGGIRLEADETSLPGRLIVHNYGHGGAGWTLCFGCAEDAVRIALARAGKNDPVAVLGSGIVGLACAHELARAGRKVRVYARAFPPETTSNAAGALWLPAGVEQGETEAARERFLVWMRRSWDRYAELGAREAATSIERRVIYEVGEENPTHGDWLSLGIIDDVETIDELPLPGPARWGHKFSSYFVETPIFLPWIMSQLDAMGVQRASFEAKSARDLSRIAEPVIINCMGLGAREVFNDTNLVPARGQLVHIEPQKLGYILQNQWSYMFPRADALVLGGTFELGVESAEPDAGRCGEILEHHRRFFRGE